MEKQIKTSGKPPPPYHDGLIYDDEPTKIYPEVAPNRLPVPPPVPVDESSPSHDPANATFTTLTTQGPPWDREPVHSTTSPDEGRPLWRRPIIWLAVVAVVIIAVLAGILGAVASGKIKTGANSSVQTTETTPVGSSGSGTQGGGSSGTGTGTGGTNTSPNFAPATTTIITTVGPVTIECPSADGLNYTTTAGNKTFKRKCNSDYSVDGDGALGVTEKTILSMPECLEACANEPSCLGAVFTPKPECRLKQYIYYQTNSINSESAVLVR
ncbi:hypothetical protein B0H63DRAFT_193567 [Podospora didyma]|uniref:Apple domain-containing protein n=1 Tax=Podospora didyma TaxID=330526 RepID=A0AAE0NG06_9PEZI|nr:hypothetical protein B0H63DRAFT_193567 [Podospora didyma]